MIEATSLRKHFGAIEAVRDVTLRAADGRITGLLGPNGAGKSTTLRILYTVLKPDSGDALIDGISAIREPLEVRKRIGVLSHGAGIYPNLTARENILYFGRFTDYRGRTARHAPRNSSGSWRWTNSRTGSPKDSRKDNA